MYSHAARCSADPSGDLVHVEPARHAQDGHAIGWEGFVSIAAAHALALIVGAGLVLWALRSATRTLVLPRSVNDSLTRVVFGAIRHAFLLVAPPTRSYEFRDRVMALYPPVALLLLAVAWVLVIAAGFTLLFWACGDGSMTASFTISASSLVTLGFSAPRNLTLTVLAFTEAMLGLVVVALLISYLPTLYSAFSRREVAVTLLEVRAGSPPSAIEMISRFWRLERLQQMTDLWEAWETWFAELDETHTSHGVLAFFRSPQPEHSWITAAGAVLDAAALRCSVMELPRDPQAELTIRAGYLALRHIADFFDVPYDPVVSWEHAISVTREEFDDACARLTASGIPLRTDLEKAWRDFVGWRVNYDPVLLELASITIAPYAPWSSDRRLLRTRTTGQVLPGGRRRLN